MRRRFVLLLPLVVAGCGGGGVDTKKGEAVIARAIREQVGARVKSVVCPRHVDAVKGDRFTCAVTGADGSKGAAEVTQRDDRGAVAVRTPFIPARAIERSVSEQVGAVAVRCPEIIPARKGDRFTCRTRAGERIRLVQRNSRGRTEIVR